MKLSEITNGDEAVLSEGLLSTIWKITKMALVAATTILLTRSILGYFERKAEEQIQHDENIESAQWIAYIGQGMTTENGDRIPSSDIRVMTKFAHDFGAELKNASGALEAYVDVEEKGRDTVNLYIAYLFENKRDTNKLKKKMNKMNKKLDIKWQFLKVTRM